MDFYCFQRWKEVPIDVTVLSLSRLSDFCQHEILRGRADLGNYHLRSGIPSSPLPVHSTPPVISAPEASVDEVRNGTNAGSDGADTFSSDGASAAHSLSPATSGQADVEPDAATDDGVVHDDGPPATVLEPAQKVLAEGKHSLDHRLQVFTVQGTLEPRLVRLFPTPSCSCPAAEGCYHIMAAKLAIGCGGEHKRRKLNLTQLRRNKSKQADKTSGRKMPRLNDVDVVPADDADSEVTATLTAAITAPGIDNDGNADDGICQYGRG